MESVAEKQEARVQGKGRGCQERAQAWAFISVGRSPGTGGLGDHGTLHLEE